MQQTCHAQMTESSIDRRSSSSPQVVWERGCTPRAAAGYQRQPRKLRQTRNVWRNCMPTSGNVSGAVEDAIGFVKEISSCVDQPPDLRAENVRKACLSSPSKTAIGLLGEIVRQSFVKLAIPRAPLRSNLDDPEKGELPVLTAKVYVGMKRTARNVLPVAQSSSVERRVVLDLV